jgi:hypothetical protein
VAIDLSDFGFAPEGGFSHMLWRYIEAMPAGGNVATQAADLGLMQPYDIVLKTPMYSVDSQDGFRADYQNLLRQLHQAQSGLYDDTTTRYGKWNYLYIRLWNGSSLTSYRLYVQILDYHVDYLWGSQLSVAPRVALRLRVVDPIWYWSTMAYKTFTTSGDPPTGSSAAYDSPSQRRVERIVFQIIKNTAGATNNVINPVLTNDRTESCQVAGTLSTTNDYWLIDCTEGRCYETSNYTSPTDVTGSKFSGDFLGHDWSGTDTIDVSGDTSGGTNCVFQVKYWVGNSGNF